MSKRIVGVLLGFFSDIHREVLVNGVLIILSFGDRWICTSSVDPSANHSGDNGCHIY